SRSRRVGTAPCVAVMSFEPSILLVSPVQGLTTCLMAMRAGRSSGWGASLAAGRRHFSSLHSFGHRRRIRLRSVELWRVRYTGTVVRLRSFAFVLALVVAAAPAVSLLCDMDCTRPHA